jgi:hypothetical protein
MVRPESCVVLAGGSPAAVSAGAPRSRARIRGEICGSERAVESLRGIERFLGREQRRGPSIKRTLQPREIGPRKGGVAEPIMSRRRQQTASVRAGRMQDAPGVRRRACVDSTARNRRDPTRQLTSSEGRPYKPSVKGAGAGRESEGLVVPKRMATITLSEGRSPALVVLVLRGKCEGMAVKAHQPLDQSTKTPTPAFRVRRVATSPILTAYAVKAEPCMTTRDCRGTDDVLEARMQREKTIGKPCAGNSHARFERGPQETEPQGCGA